MAYKSESCAKAELVELQARVKQLETALYGVLNCYEAHVARDKRYVPDDEYDAMMYPAWKRAFEAVDQDVPYKPGDEE